MVNKNAGPPPSGPPAPTGPPPVAAPPPWNSQHFRVLLNLAKNRIDIQSGKKENEIDETRRAIAQHLATNKETLARIHCERVLRERNHRQAFDILQTFIEILKNSHTVFTSQRDFESATADIKESVASVVYATSRINIQELHTITGMFRAHFGPNIIDPLGRVEGPHVSCINKILANSLEGGTPDGYLVLQELSKISTEFNLNWMAPPEFNDLDKGGGGGGGNDGYYRPSAPIAPYNVPGMTPSAPSVDTLATPSYLAPTNIPGSSYGNPPPFGGPHVPPTAPHPYAPPPGGDPLYPPSAPPSAPPPMDDAYVPPSVHPPPPPPASFLNDDDLEAKFRNVRDGFPGRK